MGRGDSHANDWFHGIDELATEQHRYLCAQQFPHELAVMCLVAWHVIGQSDILRPVTRHDAHFDGRRVARKATAIHRKPMPFRELKQHGGIAASGHHASRWRGRCKLEFLQVFTASGASDAILSVHQVGGSAIGIKHLWSR
jgi:hypothetical protein